MVRQKHRSCKAARRDRGQGRYTSTPRRVRPRAPPCSRFGRRVIARARPVPKPSPEDRWFAADSRLQVPQLVLSDCLTNPPATTHVAGAGLNVPFPAPESVGGASSPRAHARTPAGVPSFPCKPAPTCPEPAPNLPRIFRHRAFQTRENGVESVNVLLQGAGGRLGQVFLRALRARARARMREEQGMPPKPAPDRPGFPLCGTHAPPRFVAHPNVLPPNNPRSCSRSLMVLLTASPTMRRSPSYFTTRIPSRSPSIA